jgi:hypothetical protein
VSYLDRIVPNSISYSNVIEENNWYVPTSDCPPRVPDNEVILGVDIMHPTKVSKLGCAPFEQGFLTIVVEDVHNIHANLIPIATSDKIPLRAFVSCDCTSRRQAGVPNCPRMSGVSPNCPRASIQAG